MRANLRIISGQPSTIMNNQQQVGGGLVPGKIAENADRPNRQRADEWEVFLCAHGLSPTAGQRRFPAVPVFAAGTLSCDNWVISRARGSKLLGASPHGWPSTCANQCAPGVRGVQSDHCSGFGLAATARQRPLPQGAQTRMPGRPQHREPNLACHNLLARPSAPGLGRRFTVVAP